MTDEVVRMHLAQALTRTGESAVRAHLRAALDHWDTVTHCCDGSRNSIPLSHIESAATTLEAWLVSHADAGIPELVLVGLLREYADRIAELGHIPRSWSTTNTGYNTLAAKPWSHHHSSQTDHQGGRRR